MADTAEPEFLRRQMMYLFSADNFLPLITCPACDQLAEVCYLAERKAGKREIVAPCCALCPGFDAHERDLYAIVDKTAEGIESMRSMSFVLRFPYAEWKEATRR